MKAIVTLIFILFIGFAAQAQGTKTETKVATVEMGIVIDTIKEVNTASNKVARLYRRSNSRVKKALSFTTKRNKAKMA
ncbi:MAG: hypothetical protein KJN76_11780 [Eudoraea sp.]|nr:hypothetical protein [Eudoraea sp.]MBT8292045.1 hypothetical protein [Eudoraea sp.]